MNSIVSIKGLNSVIFGLSGLFKVTSIVAPGVSRHLESEFVHFAHHWNNRVFRKLGFSLSNKTFMKVVGYVELAAVFSLWSQYFKEAALVLAVLMGGAGLTHYWLSDYGKVLFTLFLGLTNVYVYSHKRIFF